MGGLKGGIARSNKFIDLRNQAIDLKRTGKTNTQIAKDLKVSRTSVIKWILEYECN